MAFNFESKPIPGATGIELIPVGETFRGIMSDVPGTTTELMYKVTDDLIVSLENPRYWVFKENSGMPPRYVNRYEPVDLVISVDE